MRIPRVYAPTLPSDASPELTLAGDEATHLSRVLRVKPGAQIEAFDGAGNAVLLEVKGSDRRGVELVYVGPSPDVDRSLPFTMSFVVSGPKGKRARRMVEGLTELGASSITPLLTERHTKALEPDSIRRWALEACKQCHRNDVPKSEPAYHVSGLARLGQSFDLCLLADTAGTRPLREILSGERPERVLVAIGPEGGFDDAERASLREAGFVPVGVGATILRVETAAQALASALVTAWA